MSDQKNLELVSVAMDRSLDLDDQAELEQLLESSAEARTLKSNFERLDAVLEAAQDIEPPASNLRSRNGWASCVLERVCAMH
jgi:hypothetical protein